MDARAVEAVINFVYTSKLCVGDSNVLSLLRVATLLQVELIQMKCSEYLENQLHPTNCLGIYSFAETHGCIHLTTKAKNFCDRNFTKVVKEEEYLSLPFERVKCFLDQNGLCVRSEVEVFDAVFHWVCHDIDSRREYLKRLLCLVRLHLLPKMFLTSQLETNEFISQ